MVRVVERNIAALIARRNAESQSQSFEEKTAALITRFTGSMKFVYVHAVIFGLWILVNLKIFPGLPAFDPSFVILAMVASVEAIFLSTFVLITQNRMSALADKRADLDLQISLLAEHEVTQMLRLLRSVAGKLGIEEGPNSELEELSKDVAPERVLDSIEHHNKTPGA